MKRRDFLAASSSFILPVMVEGFGVKAFGINSSLVQSLLTTNALAKDRALVIIYLSGGNDGLNTVIPLDQMTQYNNLRSNIAIPQASVLPLGDGTTGLHPSMTGLKQMYDNGKMSVVHSVSYPTPSYSHQRATDIWMTATDAAVTEDTGWAGRYLEDRFTNYPTSPITDRDNLNAVMEDPLAIQIGFLTSTTLLGSNQPMAIAINNVETYAALVGGGNSNLPPVDLPCNNACEASDLISFIRDQQVLAVGYAAEITAAHNAGNRTPTPVYPTGNSVADHLKIVARLIGGGLKTKVYFISIGGFDTHSRQVQSGGGTNNNLGSHATLLGRVSAGIKAFQDDLQLRGIEDKVVGFTFSEFGRRANSNGSVGTDHGVAAPMFVFGSSLKRQSVGRNPNIGGYSNLPTDLNGTIGNQDLKMQIDFRRIYWDILTDWFGRSKADAASLFLNKSFDTVSLFTDEVCTIKTGSWHDEKTWSCGRVPFTTENARICAGHSVTLNANASVKNLQNYGNLTIAAGVRLTVAGL
ncbi:MAG: DUF1501 domain-containing protein [Arcicella sp.]|nr:DUF1501 domain-containing protein [Arcicella sp.]